MGHKNKDEKVKGLILARPNYFQGVMQLRSPTEEVLEFIYTQVDKSDSVAITKKVKMPDGMDLYMTSQAFLRKLGKKLRESFGGEMRTSARLHTRVKGKDLYRVNVLYRPWKFRRGDIIKVRGAEIKITNFGNKVFGKEMKTGKKVTIRHEDLPKD
jgi:nonsense-mediated mRNA decay protein 3